MFSKYYFNVLKKYHNKIYLFLLLFTITILVLLVINIKNNQTIKKEASEMKQPAFIKQDRIAVILVNFQDTQSKMLSSSMRDPKEYTSQEIYSLMFTGNNSVKNFFEENSFGKYSISGDVFDWITIPIKTRDCMNKNFEISELIDKKIEKKFHLNNLPPEDQFTLLDYNKRVYILSSALSNSCTGGLSQYHLAKAWLYNADLSAWTHEIGHLLGLHDSGSLFCGTYGPPSKAVAIDDYSRCSIGVWGGEYDVMGGSYFHFNAPGKIYLNWISSNKIINVNKTGVFTIGPLEYESMLPQTIRIKKGDTNEYYYLEYRQPSGFDRRLSSYNVNNVLTNYAVNGALIYINDEKGTTKLIDTHPNTPGNFIDAPLRDGDFFNDLMNQIKITQISHNNDRVVIKIELNKKINNHIAN